MWSDQHCCFSMLSSLFCNFICSTVAGCKCEININVTTVSVLVAESFTEGSTETSTTEKTSVTDTTPLTTSTTETIPTTTSTAPTTEPPTTTSRHNMKTFRWIPKDKCQVWRVINKHIRAIFWRCYRGRGFYKRAKLQVCKVFTVFFIQCIAFSGPD